MSSSFFSGLIEKAPTGKKRVVVIFKLSVSILILALLISWLPTEQLLAAFRSIPWTTWALVFVGFLLGHIVAAMKWRLLLATTGVHAAPLLAVRAHGAGLFANLCLPSIVGGDLVRAAAIIRRYGEPERVAAGSLADRLNDTVALLVIAAIASLFVVETESIETERILVAVSALILTGVGGGVAAVLCLPPGIFPGRVQKLVAKLKAALISMFRAPMAGATGFLLSLLIQSGFVGLNILLAQAIGITASIYLWFFAWPLAKLVALIPVSLGGIGVREAALVGIVAPFGVEAGMAVGQGLCWQLVLISAGLVSGLLVAWLPLGKSAGFRAMEINEN